MIDTYYVMRTNIGDLQMQCSQVLVVVVKRTVDFVKK